MISFEAKFRKTKTIIWHMGILDPIFMITVKVMAYSSEIKEFLEIIEWNPKCPIVFIFKLNLLFCFLGPLIWFAWPVAIPLEECPWVTNLQKPLKTTVVKRYPFDL